MHIIELQNFSTLFLQKERLRSVKAQTTNAIALSGGEFKPVPLFSIFPIHGAMYFKSFFSQETKQTADRPFYVDTLKHFFYSLSIRILFSEYREIPQLT